MEAIAIIGMGCRFPKAQDIESFWRLLKEGLDAITEIPIQRWDINDLYTPKAGTPGKTVSRWGGFLDNIDHFDPDFFEIPVGDAQRIDPHHRLVLEVAWESLENAGIVPHTLAGSKTGVFIGMSQSDHNRLLYKDISAIDAEDGPHTFLCFVANRLSYLLNLQGPSLAIDTACSSSLVAVHLACESLRTGESNLAITGGVSLRLSPEESIALSLKGMLSPDGRCKTFDAEANGFVRGEGCGIVVLKRLDDALKDRDNILAVIRGSAVNHNGLSHGITSPNGLAQQRLLQQALENAEVSPNQIGYVETHGTASALGDAIEYKALKTILMPNREPDQPCWLGSVKSSIGHLEAAAGIASLIKATLSLQHRQIFPNLHIKQVNPYISLAGTTFSIPTALEPWTSSTESRFAGVSSFGFGGTNCHVILEEAPLLPRKSITPMERPLHLLTLSAKSEKALLDLANLYRENLQNSDANFSLADFCFSANTGRTHFDHRLAVVAESQAVLVEKLATIAHQTDILGRDKKRSLKGQQPKIVFLFPGQGTQYLNSCRQLYETQPTFRAILDRCQEILRPYLDQPLLKILYPEYQNTATHLLTETAYTQPALFALEYALAELWKSWGIIPDAVMGYSLGEYVAACVAGVFSLEDALSLVAQRGHLMQSLSPQGVMVEVLADVTQVETAIAPYRYKVAIAAVNSPKNIIISGEIEAVEAVVATLQNDNIKTRKLNYNLAFHSPLMEPVATAFKPIASTITYSSPKIRIISPITAQPIQAEIATPEYWCNQIHQPVRFADSIKTLDHQGYKVFVEVGPQSLLLAMGRECLDPGVGVWLTGASSDGSDWLQLLQNLATLYLQGVPVDWHGFDRDYPRNWQLLPTYPFQKQRYWFDQDANSFYQTTPLSNPVSNPEIACQNSLKTPSNPDLKTTLNSDSTDDLASLVLTPTAESIQNWIVNWLHQNLPGEIQLTDNSKSGKSFLDYGLKSIGAVKLAKDLEQLLGRSLEATIVWNFPTIESLALHLAGDPENPVSTVEEEHKKLISPFPVGKKAMQFSLLYFASNEAEFKDDKYRLLIESSQFADKHGFSAVWIPERHFHAFGGLYPNPAVLGSALAMVTDRIRIRAGSVVLPLHNPIRVAEEWAVVDNLSQGRVDVAFARGWNPNDFVLAPNQFANSAEVMFSGIKTVQKLWQGESILLQNGIGKETETRIYPLPKQQEIAIWITCTGGKERFVEAGAMGANVLTALLFQPIEELAEKIACYRESLAKNGYDAEAGQVTLMLHTFIGEDMNLVRHKVRKPFTAYLESSVNLWRHGITNLEGLESKERVHLLAYAFERYFQTSALIGTPESCGLMVQQLQAIGVDEIACLIDFGIDSDSIMASLYSLKKLKEKSELMRVSSDCHLNQSLTEKEKPLINLEPSQTSPKWIIDRQGKPNAKLRLFGFPHGGGDISVFKNWSNRLPPDVEVYAIGLAPQTYTGSQPTFEYLTPLVADLAEFLLPYLDLEFAFYGHSLGALINFELCRYLRRHHHKQPIHFFVGAQHAPQLLYPYPSLENLSHSDLLKFVKDLTNIELSNSVGEDDPFLQVLLNSLKVASVLQKDHYSYTEEKPLDCPITSFVGCGDKFLNQDHLSAWRVHTNKSFKLHQVDGKHLFLDSHQEQILQLISQELLAYQPFPNS
ncbi:Phenolphthiocerol synthesis polyketide synthase type I Pks15/1 [Planktothrix tepida]|uniref:Polyketide synthase type 1 n=1 Tax=Planktothrix tepida PCC 9214 TaxID=671072 RepID=A0A1J1LNV0_9CYAN|nr:type I polyketide synthase [Planktothrix tepida]CAD5954601.1 Phenolphthiocerol synthesis polyketide synthase type I Pks15/1 [Planktothrix tepida]CUR34224.1 polyketide synthase type 1 [Planktothrix tepida PCC 9214]